MRSDHEIAPVDRLDEPGRDDAHGQGQQADAHDHGEPGDHLAQTRHRHDVAVTHRGQGGDGHHMESGIEPKELRLHRAFHRMDARGGKHGGAQHQEQGTEQRAPLVVRTCAMVDSAGE